MAGTIICYGDSNTFGYDSRVGTEGRFPKEIRWTGILDDRTEYKVKNHGICGRCIPEMTGQMDFICKQIKSWAKKAAPIWLFLMLGTNDILNAAEPSAEKTAEKMKHFLERLQETPEVSEGKIELCLLVPPMMKRGSWVSDDRIVTESRKIGELYGALAEQLGIKCINCGKWELSLLYDGVHLSEEGHAEFAEKLISEPEAFELDIKGYL